MLKLFSFAILMLLFLRYTRGRNFSKVFVPINVTSPKSNTTLPRCSLLNSDGSVRPYRVVIFVDSGLLDVFLNWLIFYSNACEMNLNHLDVISMDQKVSDILSKIGIVESHQSFDLEEILNTQDIQYPKLSVIWMKRMEVLQDYIKSGVDVIFSDSDAVWFRDPVPWLSAYGQVADVVASRAWYPQVLFQRWGATLCMGFIYVRAGVFGVDFVSQISVYLQHQIDLNMTNPDDQYAANYVLHDWNVSWTRKMAVGVNSVADIGCVNRHNRRYGLVLLPHSQFLRKCHSMRATEVLAGIDNATVVHCKLPVGNGKLKSNRMRALSLWKLIESWRSDINFAFNHSGYLEWHEAVDILSDSTVVNGTIVQDISISDKLKRLTTSITRARQAARQQRDNKRKNRTAASLRQLKRLQKLRNTSELYFNISTRFKDPPKLVVSNKKKKARDKSKSKAKSKTSKSKSRLQHDSSTTNQSSEALDLNSSLTNSSSHQYKSQKSSWLLNEAMDRSQAALAAKLRGHQLRGLEGHHSATTNASISRGRGKTVNIYKKMGSKDNGKEQTKKNSKNKNKVVAKKAPKRSKAKDSSKKNTKKKPKPVQKKERARPAPGIHSIESYADIESDGQREE